MIRARFGSARDRQLLAEAGMLAAEKMISAHFGCRVRRGTTHEDAVKAGDLVAVAAKNGCSDVLVQVRTRKRAYWNFRHDITITVKNQWRQEHTEMRALNRGDYDIHCEIILDEDDGFRPLHAVFVHTSGLARLVNSNMHLQEQSRRGSGCWFVPVQLNEIPPGDIWMKFERPLPAPKRTKRGPQMELFG